MKIGFLGMSGVGKTFWANRLAAQGFACFHCDDIIGAALQADMGQPLSLAEMGAWMGFPDEPSFSAKEARYLELERQTMIDLTAELARPIWAEQNVVLDLTGSAIYAGADVLAQLRTQMLLVYLALTPAVLPQMLMDYVAAPRPLIWCGQFAQAPGEDRAIALQNSYRRLIAHRAERYEKFCQVQLAYDIHRDSRLSASGFLQIIQRASRII